MSANKVRTVINMGENSLDLRKKRILYYIIEEYLLSAEPVGSRTISKNSNIGVSAATIRNEMSDLEDLHLLIKSHASAGRIPSELGYRIYVDELLDEFRKKFKNSAESSIKLKKSDFNVDVLQLITSAAEILSTITGNIVVSALERPENTKIVHIEILKIHKNNYVMLTILDNGEVNSNTFNLNNEISNEKIRKIVFYLNSTIKNISNLDELEDLFKISLEKFSTEIESIRNIFNILKVEFLNFGSIKTGVYGLTNVFNLSEYNELNKIKNFFSFIEKKDNIIKLLNKNIVEHVEVYIGSEIGEPVLEDNSLAMTNIYLQNQYIGKLGIIGPLRMDYKNNITTLYDISWRIVNFIN